MLSNNFLNISISPIDCNYYKQNDLYLKLDLVYHYIKIMFERKGYTYSIVIPIIWMLYISATC